ncbi:hypothetical protein DCC81_04590 [Chitinophaga parva]|uniref:Uncharacterized protein n=1 Tax=Chitinophaga parva TaxID=2169414 RepID=A0A2T7BM61_9BACT|nr:hypothetical protein DCC81_04590 [Chitinophaga parva]
MEMRMTVPVNVVICGVNVKVMAGYDELVSRIGQRLPQYGCPSGANTVIYTADVRQGTVNHQHRPRDKQDLKSGVNTGKPGYGIKLASL